ncbi:hypothetical protein I4U23_023198 [Adineta vaga]|nr:hypothetical protein I4U23_023198 [Adineta vaga]
MFYSAILLSQQYGITIGGEYLGWRTVVTTGSPMNALRTTCEAVSTSNIVGIIGPSSSREAHVLAPFTEDIDIPIISYAATDPELSDRKTFSTFYRTVPSDTDAALAMAKLFLRFNWATCIIIYQNDAFGSGGAKAISETFTQNKIIITEMIVFDMVTLTIRGDLKSILTRSLTRTVVLWADSNYATLILHNALQLDVVGPQFTWILGSDVPLTAFDDKWHDKLIGMLTIGPVVGNVANAPINRTLLNDAYDIWQKYEPESFPGPNNVDNYALFAFDATWALIQSFAQLCSSKDLSSCISFTNTSFCFDRRALNIHSIFDIINTNIFLGVSGPVQFYANETNRLNGTYYIVQNAQHFSGSSNYVPVLVSSDSADWTLHAQTNTIIWPGQTLTSPSGYAAINGVTLRIAVIETAPFTMVREIRDAFGKTTTKLVGYVPDLIERLREKMGFIANITVLPTSQAYNELADAVANNVYDMVVGDVTIMASRREKAAFSEAIFDNSLRIIVRHKAQEFIPRFAFLRPFPK